MNRALRAATMGVLLLSPVALSACSAGQVSQTATQQRDKTGAMAQVGNITLREVQLAYPTGGTYESGDDADLVMAIVNTGDKSDTLTGVEGKGFSGADISEGGSSSGATSSGATSSDATSSSAAPSGGASSSGATSSAGATSGSATSSSASSSSATSSGATSSSAASSTAASGSVAPGSGTSSGGGIEIPAGTTVFVGLGDSTVTLTGLEDSLTTGQFIDVTLTFEEAGDVTVPVTVANPKRALEHGEPYNFNQGENNGGEVARSSENAGGQ